LLPEGATTDKLFEKLEKVVLIKLNDFTNHDLVAVLHRFYEMRKGSEEFYEKVMGKLLKRRKQLRDNEFIKFFVIFPKVTYFYENNMNEQIWNDYLD
jgi:hypothetical protein